MTAITKSVRKLEGWAGIRDLDRAAMPLIERYGVVEAYRMALEGGEEETSAAASNVSRFETLRAGDWKCS